MAQKNIKKLLKNTDLALSIGKNSQELKSLSKGQINENLVARYLEIKGCRIVCRNTRFFGVEIDLIVKKKNSYVLIEVKSLNHEFLLEKIISSKQKRRLQKVASMLAYEFTGSLSLFLATVSPKKEISFFQLMD